MALIEGTQALKTLEAVYDFAVDGGAQGALTLRSDHPLGNNVPAGSVVVGGYIDVTDDCLSATGTIAIALEAAEDVLAESLEAALVAGRIDVIPDSTGSTSVKTTVARSLVATIATADFTAGAFRVVLFYR